MDIVKSLNLAYSPCRKVASTSIRRALRELARSQDDYWSSWDLPLPTLNRLFARGRYKFAVVRDPAERFLSAYRNRVRHHRDVVRKRVDRLVSSALGLSPSPGIDAFCRDFFWYYLFNDTIHRHFALQRKYLGSDLGHFDKVYRLEELDDLAADLSDLAGREVTLPRLQTGGPKVTFGDLSRDTRSKILNFTMPDYRLLRDYYRPHEIRGINRSAATASLPRLE